MEIENLSRVVEIISRGVENEAAIAIADRRRFIYYQPGKSIDLPIHPGDVLREGSVSLQTVQAKTDVSTQVEPYVFGVPYYAMGHPVIENNRLTGCVTAIFPVKREIQKHNASLLIGKADDRFIPILFDDIHWIYADNRRTFIHTDRGDFQNRYSLQQLESILPGNRFMRCHRAYIVNIDSISEIHPQFHSTFQLVIKDTLASHIPVSQTYASTFRDFLGF